MNADWAKFLKTNNLEFPEDTNTSRNIKAEHNSITAVPYLSCIKVTGSDASTFLQGQISCDVNNLNESKSFFSAFCNAKGRTITTLIVVKTTSGFLLILPAELIDKVTKKLQMYILRSDVQLKNMSDELCISGVNTQSSDTLDFAPTEPFSIYQNNNIYIKFPLHSHRYLVISDPAQAIALWTDLTTNGNFLVNTTQTWAAKDISAGIPWLTLETTEQFIPQMLNIDKLGGISFNKGCYTGQEIIARTHYLGKAKRELFLAYCDKVENITTDTQIITDNNEQVVGKILCLQNDGQQTKLLTVLQSADTELKNLRLNNSNQDKINIIDFH